MQACSHRLSSRALCEDTVHVGKPAYGYTNVDCHTSASDGTFWIHGQLQGSCTAAASMNVLGSGLSYQMGPLF